MTPEQALKIAASQWKSIPTAEQIVAALDAAGFYIATLGDENPAMSGNEIKELRKLLGFTQSEVAEAAGTIQQNVDKIESGVVENSRFVGPIIAFLQRAKRNAGDDPASYLRSVLAKHNITATELARKIGVAQTTLNRQINVPGYMVSTRTLRKVREWEASQLS